MGLYVLVGASISAVDCSSPRASPLVPLALEMSSMLANVSARPDMVRSAFAKFLGERACLPSTPLRQMWYSLSVGWVLAAMAMVSGVVKAISKYIIERVGSVGGGAARTAAKRSLLKNLLA